MNIKRLWNLADALRGSNIAIEPVILAGLSLKYLEQEFGGRMPNEAKLHYLIKDAGNINENLVKAFNFIENEFPELRGVYKSLGVSWVSIDNKSAFDIILAVHKEPISDFAAAVHEIRNFTMRSSGKRGGEHLTSDSLNQLLITLLDIEEAASYYDGAAGYAGTLIEAKRQHGKKNISLYGQEVNKESWAIGKLCLLMTGNVNANFLAGNTLTNPLFIEEGRIKKFDYVAMSMPFSMRLTDQAHEILENDPYNRFTLGAVPKSSADMAFIQHALSSSTGKGRVILTVSNGALFRGGSEQAIRRNLIDTDQIEAIIALPQNLLHYTGIPVNLLVLNRNKPNSKQGKIQFIQANELFAEQGRVRYLTNDHIDKIHTVLNDALEERDFSRLVPLTELEENLTVNRYLQDSTFVMERGETYQIHLNQLNHKTDNTAQLQSLGKIYRGLNVTSKTSEETGNGDFKLIKMSDVQDGKVLMDELTGITMKTNFKPSLYQVEEGDIIVSSRGHNVKVAVVPSHDGTVLLSQNFIGFRPLKNKLNSHFLQVYLESPIGQYHLSNLMGGTTLPVLNPKQFGTLEVVLPPLNVQEDAAVRYQKAKTDYENALKEATNRLAVEKMKVYEEIGILKSFELIE